MFAAVPVPQRTTRCGIAVTRCAISGSITCSHSGSCWYGTRSSFGASFGTFANSTRRTAHALAFAVVRERPEHGRHVHRRDLLDAERDRGNRVQGDGDPHPVGRGDDVLGSDVERELRERRSPSPVSRSTGPGTRCRPRPPRCSRSRWRCAIPRGCTAATSTSRPCPAGIPCSNTAVSVNGLRPSPPAGPRPDQVVLIPVVVLAESIALVAPSVARTETSETSGLFLPGWMAGLASTASCAYSCHEGSRDV